MLVLGQRGWAAIRLAKNDFSGWYMNYPDFMTRGKGLTFCCKHDCERTVKHEMEFGCIETKPQGPDDGVGAFDAIGCC